MVKKSSYKIVWDKQVLDHFIDILAYLKKQSTQAPKIVKDAILLKLDLVKINPLICELDNLKDPSESHGGWRTRPIDASNFYYLLYHSCVKNHLSKSIKFTKMNVG